MGIPSFLARRAKRVAQEGVIALEGWWDSSRLNKVVDQPPEDFRIETYLGHGAGAEVVVRGRVLDNPEVSAVIEGERTRAAVGRTLARFLTDELPDVPLRVRVGTADVETTTDAEGYFDLRVPAGLTPSDGPWAVGSVGLASSYRGLEASHTVEVQVRVPGEQASFGVISDVDDTILLTGAQRTWVMVRQTFTGSFLTRVPLPGAAELYRALAAEAGDREANPFFYVSSSPWNLHGFLVAFLRHRGFPPGPLLLRDLLGRDAERSHGTHKHARIEEVLALHPDLSFVLVGDSGQHDPEIYAEVVRRHPGRIAAVYIREVRLDPGDRRVEAISEAWNSDVPFVLAADSAVVARHAAGLGLLDASDVDAVEAAVARADE